jgi:MYXO-CTERM domain-containing protein
VIVNNADCMVEVTKIDYNQPGNDTADFIELKVTKKNPGVVTTLLNCGIGAIALYDDSSLGVGGICLTNYSLTVLGGVTIPADGYIEIGQNQANYNVTVGSDAQGWLHNGRGEIAFLQTALSSGSPVSWFQYGGAAKCNGSTVPVQVQTEDDTSPNTVNVSCSGTNTFHLVNATSAVQKTIADCPASGGAGGAGGGGGSGGTGGTGLLSGLGGTGGVLNLGGTGGLVNLAGLLDFGGTGGTAGLLNLGGAAQSGNAGQGGTAGSSNVGGAAHAGTAGNSNTAGHAGTSTAGEAGEAAGAPDQGDAGQSNGLAGASNAHGGATAAGAGHGAAAGKAETGDAGADVKGSVMVAEGGGCSCSVPNTGNRQRTQALAVLAALLGLCIRRRKTRPN